MVAATCKAVAGLVANNFLLTFASEAFTVPHCTGDFPAMFIDYNVVPRALLYTLILRFKFLAHSLFGLLRLELLLRMLLHSSRRNFLPTSVLRRK